jgi:hypothetical protein
LEVDFAFLADAAEVTQGKLYVMGGAFDTIWTSNVPVSHLRLSFVMRLLFMPAEVGRRHRVEINLMDEDGKGIAKVGGELEIGQNPNLCKGWRQGFLTALNFPNLKFEKFGDYSFEIVVNNTSLKSTPLRIAQRIQLQAQA